MPEFVDAVGRVQIILAFVGLVLMLLWESAHPFFEFFSNNRQVRLRHVARNLAVGAVNALIVAIVFVGLWIAAAAWAESRAIGLLNVLDLPLWAHAVGAVLLFDAWTYVWHWLNHRIPFLWRFHRVHHSDAHMDVTTASRFHAGEIVFSSLLRIPLIILFGIHVWELLLYETMMFAVVQFHHANVGLSSRTDRLLRAVIVTPAMHKVHHSSYRPETDSNYSAFLSLWDRLAGTFRLRERPKEIEYGVPDVTSPDETVSDLFTMPFFGHSTDRSNTPHAGSGPATPKPR